MELINVVTFLDPLVTQFSSHFACRKNNSDEGVKY